MIEQDDVLRPVLGALSAINARWALVGGLAVTVRSVPRFTQDIDLAVAVDSDIEAEHVVSALTARGLRVVSIIEQSATGRLALASLALEAEDDQAVVTLLFATSGIEPEIVVHAELMEILPALVAPVAQVGHLIALKVLSRDDQNRPQDVIDLRALLSVATAADLELAWSAVELIQGRGYNRSLDLSGALERALQQFQVET